VTTPSLRRTRIARVVSLAVALGIWFVPPPDTLSPQAWHLFAIFAATILSVVIGAFPILTASVLALDAVIAPAFPSNTARSGVLFPLALSVTEAAGATPEREDRRRLGRFLMFSGMMSLTLSSALWLTAMAGNPLGAEIAKQYGVEISFGSWLLAASVPTLLAMIVLPYLYYKIIRPEVTDMPNAPAEARKALAALGPMTRNQKIVGFTFLGMVILWGVASTLGIDPTAVAFLGLGVLLATGVLTLADIAREGDVLATFIWFAALFTLSDQLNQLGFMEFLGGRLVMRLGGLPAPVVGVVLLVVYVLLHYLFVSQTAHLLALFGVFLGVGVKLGVPAPLLALQLLFATNYFAAIAPQASSANLLFAGSGYFTQGELYRLGAVHTALCVLLYLVIGTPWVILVTR
jgi:DASS family divalent anion:Na+ symporter